MFAFSFRSGVKTEAIDAFCWIHATVPLEPSLIERLSSMSPGPPHVSMYFQIILIFTFTFSSMSPGPPHVPRYYQIILMFTITFSSKSPGPPHVSRSFKVIFIQVQPLSIQSNPTSKTLESHFLGILGYHEPSLVQLLLHVLDFWFSGCVPQIEILRLTQASINGFMSS